MVDRKTLQPLTRLWLYDRPNSIVTEVEFLAAVNAGKAIVNLAGRVKECSFGDLFADTAAAFRAMTARELNCASMAITKACVAFEYATRADLAKPQGKDADVCENQTNAPEEDPRKTRCAACGC